jgi:hypothetical protein
VVATEIKTRLLEDLLHRIETRRRAPDGSLPARTAAAPAETHAGEAPKEEAEAEEIPYFPEEFEKKPAEAPAAAPGEKEDHLFELKETAEEKPAPAGEAGEEEEGEGEVTDKIEPIPPITPRMIEEAAAKSEKEEMTLPWFGEPAEIPQQPEPGEVKEISGTPAAPVTPVDVVAPVVISREKGERGTEPEAIPALPAFIKAKPFAVSGSPVVKSKLTMGLLLLHAFTIGEH